MLVIEYINKKEFQANRAKFNVTGLYTLSKLPAHLAKPLLYTIAPSFIKFSPFLHPFRVHVCQGKTEGLTLLIIFIQMYIF